MTSFSPAEEREDEDGWDEISIHESSDLNCLAIDVACDSSVVPGVA